MEPSRPDLSVIVVTRDTRDITLRCIDALRANTPAGYELIVVDNASSDGSAEAIRATGPTVLRNETNLGFGAAVNMGAAMATGRYLLLLNSDAFVEPGWLAPMLAAIGEPGTAAVVPMVLNMDGTLQEAGRLVSGDGRTIAHGVGDDPEDPAYRFPRIVDYGSALCMLIRRDAFTAAGGFDPAYGLGYCEDVDLCFRFADRGWLVRYVPRARVRHIGGASSDPTTIEELVRANTRVLRARWARRLSRRPPLAGGRARGHRLAALRDIEVTDRILVAARARFSPLAESFVTTAARLWPKALITVIAPEATGATDELLDEGVEVVIAPAKVGSWLGDRILHYSTVIIDGPVAAHRYADDLHHAQPHALFVYCMNGEGAGTEHRASEVAELRRTTLVWSSSAVRLSLAAVVAHEAEAFLAPEGGWSRDELPGIACHLGMAPPDATPVGAASAQ